MVAQESCQLRLAAPQPSICRSGLARACGRKRAPWIDEPDSRIWRLGTERNRIENTGFEHRYTNRRPPEIRSSSNLLTETVPVPERTRLCSRHVLSGTAPHDMVAVLEPLLVAARRNRPAPGPPGRNPSCACHMGPCSSPRCRPPAVVPPCLSKLAWTCQEWPRAVRGWVCVTHSKYQLPSACSKWA